MLRGPLLLAIPLVLATSVVIALFSILGNSDGDSSPSASVTASPATGSPSLPGSTNSPAPGDTSAPTDVPGDTGDPTDPPSETVPPSSVGLLTLVDKQHGLPATYAPPDLAALPDGYLAPGYGGSLRQEAADALIQMLDAAYTDGYDIRARSAYRSYAEQQTTFHYWGSVLGYDEATRVSALPGHSEHQLGTAADLTTADVGWELVESFGATAAGQWLAGNAAEYGFALSYPEGGEPTTGYAYEPWHFRYIGPSEAAAFAASGLYLNQYLAQ